MTNPLADQISARRSFAEVVQNLPNWQQRLNAQFNDDMGTLGLADLPLRMPEVIQGKGGSLTPDKWEALIKFARQEVQDAGSIDAALPAIQKEIEIDFHPSVSHYVACVANVNKLAIDALGKDASALKIAQDTMGGLSAESQYASFAYANEIARLTVNKLENTTPDDITGVVNSFAQAAVPLEGPNFAFAIEQLKGGLLERKPEWQGSTKGSLKPDISQKIVAAFQNDEMSHLITEPPPRAGIRR